MAKAKETINTLINSVESVLKGQHKTITKIVIALITGGHILLEDFPGTGKTTLAKAISLSVKDAKFNRLQFTPDLLPSDILGVSIWDTKNEKFKFHPGPIFANILLADEINRASPRSQSALLEVMAESQATIEGKRHEMPKPFFVLATQNPVEFRGTYPLPEAQLDRFAMQLSLGYLSVDDEVALLNERFTSDPLDKITPLITLEDIAIAHKQCKEVTITDELKKYIVDIVNSTRSAQGVTLPASPRASLTLMQLSQAFAVLDGRDYVIPDDIVELAVDVIAHRIVLDSQHQFGGTTNRAFVENLLKDISVPV